MAIPTVKAPQIADFLNAMGNRTEAIYTNKCASPPAGCGGDASQFKDPLSRQEYTILGLCQNCQDKIFGGSDDD
jgi:hypothetical protein